MHIPSIKKTNYYGILSIEDGPNKNKPIVAKIKEINYWYLPSISMHNL